MKKKKVIFSPKLFLQKDTIAELNMATSHQILGGADTIADWYSQSPCGPCDASLGGGCPTRQYSLCENEPRTQGVCCGVAATGINGPC